MNRQPIWTLYIHMYYLFVCHGLVLNLSNTVTLLHFILLQESLKEKDLSIRKYEQEVDSLTFRNNQLSSRVASLQQELEETRIHGKKHKVIFLCLQHTQILIIILYF